MHFHISVCSIHTAYVGHSGADRLVVVRFFLVIAVHLLPYQG